MNIPQRVGLSDEARSGASRAGFEPRGPHLKVLLVDEVMQIDRGVAERVVESDAVVVEERFLVQFCFDGCVTNYSVRHRILK